MSRIVDITGQRFGHLTVLDRDESEHNADRKIAWWFVQCDCGTITSVRGTSLRSGMTTSCGCGLASRKDITGQVFDYLTVLKYDRTSPPGKTKWICQCRCGKIISVDTCSLRNRHVTSCGCKHERKSLLGQRFGRLLVIDELQERRCGNVQWVCKCDCGNTVTLMGGNLTSGRTKSCGCLNSDMLVARNSKYKDDTERHLGYILDGMKERCYCKTCSAYRNYGARGIYICDEWLHDSVAFVKWSLANGFIEGAGLSIDRIDNDGPYAPWNCRWTTRLVQANNTRSNAYLTIDGETKSKSDWARVIGKSPKLLHKRSIDAATKYVKEVLERQQMPKR